MNNLIEKLNMDIGEYFDPEYSRGVVFCARNMVKVFMCPTEIVEDALNKAGYWEEDGDYTISDLNVLCDVVNDFGTQEMKHSCILEKHIWFDSK